MTATQQTLTCEKCQGHMIRNKIPRFGVLIQILGVVLVLPALGGMAFGVLAAVGAIGGAAASGDPSNAAAAGLAAAMGLGMTVLAFAISLPVLIAGAILIMRRKVWQCGSCDFVFERA